MEQIDLFNKLTRKGDSIVPPTRDELDAYFANKAAARHTDPATSRQAAADAAPRAPSNRETALRVLASAGALTDFELAAITGRQQTSIGKRRGECVTAGLARAVVDSEGVTLTRPAPSGSRATVWEITDAGRAYLAAISAGGE